MIFLIILVWFLGAILTAILGGIFYWPFRPDLAILWPYGLPRLIILNKQFKKEIREHEEYKQKWRNMWK